MKKILLFSYFLFSCFNKASMSSSILEKKLLLIQNKYELNTPLDSKDFNYIFIYLDNIEKYNFNKINAVNIADFIIYSNERELLRKYIHSYKKFKDDSKLKIGISKIRRLKPKLVKYFEKTTDN